MSEAGVAKPARQDVRDETVETCGATWNGRDVRGETGWARRAGRDVRGETLVVRGETRDVRGRAGRDVWGEM